MRQGAIRYLNDIEKGQSTYCHLMLKLKSPNIPGKWGDCTAKLGRGTQQADEYM